MSADDKGNVDNEGIWISFSLVDGESFVVPKDMSKIYKLDDTFVTDPFSEGIALRKQEGGSNYVIYADYEQALQYLREIWKRLQAEYWNMYLLASQITFEMESDADNALVKENIRTAQLIELDTESFIIFANRFMDKIGKVIERMIKPDDGKQVKAGFKEHVAFFTKPENRHYNADYSKYLSRNTSWYKLLSLMRDKLIEHGKTFYSSLYISQNHGIMYMKIDDGIDRPRNISMNDTNTLYQIWQKYPQVQTVLGAQPWRIVRHIMKNNIDLSEEDFKKFTETCTRMGGFHAKILDLKFAYSTNGKAIEEYDFIAKKQTTIDKFPTPDKLWERLNKQLKLSDKDKEALIKPFNRDSKSLDGKVIEPRYYQEIAINAAMTAILHGFLRNDKRNLFRVITDECPSIRVNNQVSKGSDAEGCWSKY